MSSPTKKLISTGTKWEKIAGFSRALRIGQQIFVAGTTATSKEGTVGKGNPAVQMQFILDRIENAIVDLGGKLADVVRTRIYVRNINDWEIVAKIHGERFRDIKPVSTLVQAQLVGDCLVEVEADAILQN
jgi:enamine deaminase RidA (YjgF/YER057c/UK114 family)